MSNNKFIQNLYTHPLAKREIDLLLCHFLKINTAGLMIYNEKIAKPIQDQIIIAIQNRVQGMPLAYITGSKGFWKLDLKVNQHTLIPRPETEQLVELVLKWTDENFSGSILDLGTGSGAIALSLAYERLKAQITAVDFSSESIKVAETNRQFYNLENVNILHSDWFNNLTDYKFDYILSNPPYVAENDTHLKNLSYEPITALTSKKNGFADLQHIIQKAPLYLEPNGRLILEHGYNQKELLHKLLQQNCYNNVKTYDDLAGIPRITTAQR